MSSIITNDQILEKLYQEHPFLKYENNERIDKFSQIIFIFRNRKEIIFNKPLIKLRFPVSHYYRYVNLYGKILEFDADDVVAELKTLKDFNEE